MNIYNQLTPEEFANLSDEQRVKHVTFMTKETFKVMKLPMSEFEQTVKECLSGDFSGLLTLVGPRQDSISNSLLYKFAIEDSISKDEFVEEFEKNISLDLACKEDGIEILEETCTLQCLKCNAKTDFVTRKILIGEQKLECSSCKSKFVDGDNLNATKI